MGDGRGLSHANPHGPVPTIGEFAVGLAHRAGSAAESNDGVADGFLGLNVESVPNTVADLAGTKGVGQAESQPHVEAKVHETSSVVRAAVPRSKLSFLIA